MFHPSSGGLFIAKSARTTHPARTPDTLSPSGVYGSRPDFRQGELYKIHLLYSLHSYKVHNARIISVYLPPTVHKRPAKLHKEHSGKYTFPEGEQSARLSIRAGDPPRVPSPTEHRRGVALRRRSKGLGRFPDKRSLPILTAIRIACPFLRVQCPACQFGPF